MGQHRQALVAAEEATERSRILADADPNTFLPDLARSLGMLGLVHRGSGNPHLAAAANDEGVRLLLPIVEQSPRALTPLLKALLRAYGAACREGSIDPDPELVQLLGDA
jgi:hypothetical protein